jgi:hypothetical protein
MDEGDVADVDEIPVLDFDRAVSLANFSEMPNGGENVDTTPPWMVSATVENDSPGTARVVFNGPAILHLLL